MLGLRLAYSRQFEVAQDTATLTAHYASIPDLGRAGVAVHLGELELGFGADSRREGRVADDVSKSLPRIRS